MIEHLDETGQPCTRHVPSSPNGLLALALLGSRMPGLHHDIASKLQGLMMAMEEINELAETLDQKQAASAANLALRELVELFTANRVLAKPPRRTPTPLAEVVAQAAERSGVRTSGELPPLDVDISMASVAHVLAVLLDLVAGPLNLGRKVEIHTTVEASHVVMVIVGPPTAMDKLPPNSNDMLALGSFALFRESGELRCGMDRLTIKLPLTP